LEAAELLNASFFEVTEEEEDDEEGFFNPRCPFYESPFRPKSIRI
jgi:hypothetical protein